MKGGDFFFTSTQMRYIYIVNIHMLIPILPAAKNPHPAIHGLGSALNLSGTPTVTCDAFYFGFENVSFAWSINGKPLAANKIEKDHYADNSANFQTKLDYELTRLDDQMNLTCSLFVENGVLGNYEKKTSAVVNLHCKYN